MTHQEYPGVGPQDIWTFGYEKNSTGKSARTSRYASPNVLETCPTCLWDGTTSIECYGTSRTTPWVRR